MIRNKGKMTLLFAGALILSMLCACGAVSTEEETASDETVVTEKRYVLESDQEIVDKTINDNKVGKLIDAIIESNNKEDYEELNELHSSLVDYPQISGIWNRTNVHSSEMATLSLTSLGEQGFDYTVTALYFSHSGVLSGQAFWVSENTAISKIDLYGNSSSFQYILFHWEDGELKIYATAYSADLGFGMEVSMDGTYTKDAPYYTNENVLHDTFTDEQLEYLKEWLPDEYYENIIFTTENGGVNVSEDEETSTIKISGYVPTMSNYGYDMVITDGFIKDIIFFDGVEYIF